VVAEDVEGQFRLPSVSGNRLWITGYNGDDRVVLCYDAAKGTLLWRRAVPKLRSEPPNPMNGPSTPTPTTDASPVFVVLPGNRLFASRRRWQGALARAARAVRRRAGHGASPVLAEGNVILLIDTPNRRIGGL